MGAKQRKEADLALRKVEAVLKPGETHWEFTHAKTKSLVHVKDKTWFAAHAQALTLLGAEPGSLTWVARAGLHKK